MGQKTHPIGFRLAVTKDWRSKWFADKKHFGELLVEDYKIRQFIKKRLEAGAISKIIIERFGSRCRITIYTARPGVVIGKRGQELERLKEELISLTGGKEIYIDIIEIRKPELDAQLVAENIALQLERRISFRRAMKRAAQLAMEAGAEGIKIRCSGRLGGAEIARAEIFHVGRVPLQTLRADIDYGFAEAWTTYGRIGVKVWICKGEKIEKSGTTKEDKETQKVASAKS